MDINKENVLDELKDLVLVLVNSKVGWVENEDLLKKFSNKFKKVSKKIEQFSEDDKEWIGKKYKEFHEKEIIPKMEKNSLIDYDQIVLK